MDLTELLQHWDKFGKTTPLWSILTDPTKQENDWNLSDFFHTGVEEIGASLDHVRKLGSRSPQAAPLISAAELAALRRRTAYIFASRWAWISHPQ
jgi:hypothetical protein